MFQSLSGRPRRFGELPNHEFRSLSCYFDAPLSWIQLRSVLEGLLDKHRGHLVRVKGVVYLSDRMEPVAVHAASGRLYQPNPLPVRPDSDKRSRLVFITVGASDSLVMDLTSALDGGAVRIH